MKAAELRHKESAELEALAEELRADLFRLRMQHHTGQLDKSSRLRQTKRDIARINSVLRERELSEQAEQGAS